MKIALINVPSRDGSQIDKDLVGGIGQVWEFGNSFSSKLISSVRKKAVCLPILSMAYSLAAIKKAGAHVKYFESLPNESFDVFFIYGSMVDYENENTFADKLKDMYPNSKVGFVGTFPSKYPEYFRHDFVIFGEVEAFFLYQFLKEKEDYTGVIKVEKQVDMDDLPSPDFEGFPIKKYCYLPALEKKPVLTLQASRGCPFSCGHYCAYGSYQGSEYRKRSAEKLFGDIKTLVEKYNVKSIQFRDPTFGLDKNQVKQLCKLLLNNNVKIEWGIETRIDILDKDIIKIMAEAGLVNINIGVETINPKIAELNKRKLSEIAHQEEIVRFCKKLGVKISAFYMFGYPGDTEESIEEVINYSIRLNTSGARFAICTPFPGTKFFESLKNQGKIKTFDFSKYNSFRLVFEHDTMTEEQLCTLVEQAFKKYYFRAGYVVEFLKWKIRRLLKDWLD